MLIYRDTDTPCKKKRTENDKSSITLYYHRIK